MKKKFLQCSFTATKVIPQPDNVSMLFLLQIPEVSDRTGLRNHLPQRVVLTTFDD